MKFFYFLLLSLLIASAIPEARACQEHHAASPAFFKNLNDVPLMPGLSELTTETVLFDKPEGRFVESAAVSDNISSREIADFYDETLPHLGWQRIDNGRFVRQEESLQINIRKEGSSRLVVVTVMPRLPASP